MTKEKEIKEEKKEEKKVEEVKAEEVKEVKEEKKVKEAKEEKKKETKKVKEEEAPSYDVTQAYPIEEAVELMKGVSKAKFDASVEIHFRLGIDPKKGDQQVRGAVNLPHGTGKDVKVAAFVAPENEKAAKEAGADFFGGEDLITEIKKTGKTDFQVAIAEPIMMKKLGVIAKTLGTRGLMPSPKNGTVTPDPAKAVGEMKKGKVNFKNDDTSNLHSVIGKVSFDSNKLIENYQALLEMIKKVKPNSSKGVYIRNISISSSMSPGVKVIVD